MEKSILINRYGEIDHLEIQTKCEYVDNRWLFYVTVAAMNVHFCIESESSLNDAIHSLVLSSLEHMHWHLEEINNEK